MSAWRLRAAAALTYSFLAGALAIAAAGLSRAAPAPRPLQPYLTCYFQSDLTDLEFQKKCQAKVTGNWAVPKSRPKAGSKAVVQSGIDRSGKLISALLTMKSGSQAWDDAALAAVKKSDPFPPLPKSFGGKQIQIHWHFEMR